MAPNLASLALALASLPLIIAQQISTPENRPHLDTFHCTRTHGCVKQKTTLVLDALIHPIHSTSTPSTPCTLPNGSLNQTLCPNKQTCASNCAIAGIPDYAAHGVSTNGAQLTFHQYLPAAEETETGTNTQKMKPVSPRVYLVSESGETYKTLHLLNQEFTFDVDVSNLPCGMNGALYLVEMPADGGRSELNPAGAAYGTGYCDAQCFNLPFIKGEANTDGHGSCCNEMDIWEANSRAQVLTPHSCTRKGLYECSSSQECGLEEGVCDKWGCSFNPYGLGDREYYGRGRGFEVDTRKPFTVVTQFIASNATSGRRGRLSEIRRLYIQDGRIIQNAKVYSDAVGAEVDSLTDAYCGATADWFQTRGGLEEMGRALDDGMVLAMSIWNDAGDHMQWLDGARDGAGPCNATEGAPEFIERTNPGTSVRFGNIRWGDIGETFKRRH